MTITLPRSVLLGLALAALSMMGIVPAAGAATVRPAADPHAAAPTPSPVLHGQACPNVMVIAARGTNEAPINWQDLSAYTTSQNYYGAGAEIYSLYQSLESGSADTFSLDPVVYPVTLPSGTSLPGLVGSTVQYLGDARIGAEGIALDIQNTDAECGHTVHYILAGYSLGAWAVHDALHELSPAQLGEISGVALFGDPLFVPFLPTVRDYYLADRALGAAVLLDPFDISIPSAVASSTGSWCFPSDPICQAIGNPYTAAEFAACLLDAKANSTSLPCAHFDYPGTETAKAAAFLEPFLPVATPPDAPGNVTAVAEGQYTIQVTWTDASTGITGLNIDNGCPVGDSGCSPGATLAQTTGPVDSATFSVTPGTYQCFRVQAFNNAGTSPWSGYGCTSTPGLAVPGTQQWTNTGVTVAAGDTLGLTASGQITVSPTESVGPGGDPSCTPAQDYPAPALPCFSLIARIGTGAPFEVGTSALVTTGSGVLYLGINDDSFSGNSGSWTVNIKLGGLPPPA